ncbi:MAG: Ig-like domain-containing protein [Acidobacteriota bacterium]|nr:Ig-like domain-containing protein [Acidobacteriota bacterium]
MSQIKSDFWSRNTNLIANGGFEYGTLAPFENGVVKGELSLEYRTEHVRSGDYAMRFFAKDSNAYTSPWNGSNRVARGTGETYTFKAWVKADAPNTRIRLFIFFYDKNGKTSSPYFNGANYVAGTEWTEFSISNVAPPDFPNVGVRVDVRDSGRTAWFDDLHLAPAPNLIPNPGFEADLSQSPFSTVSRGTMTRVATEVYKGDYALQIAATGNDCYTSPYQGQNAVLSKAAEGDKFIFSGRVKADVVGQCQFRIFALDANYKPIGSQRLDLTTNTNWKRGEVELTCPAGTNYVSVRLDNDAGAGSTMWFDHLSLEKQVEPIAVNFLTPDNRMVYPTETYDLGQIIGRESFTLSLPQGADELTWADTRGPVNVSLAESAESGSWKGTLEYDPDAVDLKVRREGVYLDFSVELQFSMGQTNYPVTVTGQVKTVDWDIRITGGLGNPFSIELGEFPETYFWDVEITNFSAGEELIIPINDLFVSVLTQPIGITTEFIVTGVQDPAGIDPFGVVSVSSGVTEVIPLRVNSNFNADGGPYDIEVIGIPRNGFSQSARLTGEFIRPGQGLDIRNFSVNAVPGGETIDLNESYVIPTAVTTSGTDLSFDLRNFNTEEASISSYNVTVVQAPENSNLAYNLTNAPLEIIGANGGITSFGGTLDFEPEGGQGAFRIVVEIVITDTQGGFSFNEVFSFTVEGNLGGDPPCTDNCARLLIKATPQGTVNPSGVVGIVQSDSPIANQINDPPASFDRIIVIPDNGDSLEMIKNLADPGSFYLLEFFNEVPNTELTIQTIGLRGWGNHPTNSFCINNSQSDPCTDQLDLSAEPLPIWNTGRSGRVVWLGFGNSPEFQPDPEVIYTARLDVIGSTPTIEFGLPLQGNVLGGAEADSLEVQYNRPPLEPVQPDSTVSVGTVPGGSTKRLSFQVRNSDLQQVFSAPVTTVNQNTAGETFGFFPVTETLTIQPGQLALMDLELKTNTVAEIDQQVEYTAQVLIGPPDDPFVFNITATAETAELVVELIDERGFASLSLSNGDTYGFPTISKENDLFQWFQIANNSPVDLEVRNVRLQFPEPPDDPGVGGGFTIVEPLPDMFTIFVAQAQPFLIQASASRDDGFWTQELAFQFRMRGGTWSDFVVRLTGDSFNTEIKIDIDFGVEIDFPIPDPPQGSDGNSTEVSIRHLGGSGSISGTLATTGAFSVTPSTFSLSQGQELAALVSFNATQNGNYSGVLTMTSNDPVWSTYKIRLAGTVGPSQPSGTFFITHGPTTPVDHNTDFEFGNTAVGTPLGKNFRIWNLGNVPLDLPRSNFQVPAGYQLIETPDGPIPPVDGNGNISWDNFSVRLTAANAGQFNGDIRITNGQNFSPNPYIIHVTGTVGPVFSGPDGVRVTHGATEVPHLSLFPFGNTEVGTFIGKNFRIYNETSGPLTFPRANFSVPPGYQLVETPNGPIPPPDPDGTLHWDNFSVHLSAVNAGVFNGQINFTGLDASNREIPTYRINVTGSVDPDPACIGDSNGPDVTITAPADGAVLDLEPVTIRVTASDAAGVDKVLFFVNGNRVSTDTSAPYQYTWNPSSPNTYALAAQAFDNCGNQTWEEIQVTVQDPCADDLTGPSVEITNPQNGAVLEPGLIQITATASDVNGVERVVFLVNGSEVGTDFNAPFSQGYWFTVEGPQTVTVNAYDHCGNPRSDTVSFTITESSAPCEGDNILPWGSITAPADGAVLQPGNVTLTATAGDNVNVSAVAFEIDGDVPAGATDLSPPYQFTWNAQPGTHTIRLRIQDVCTNIGYSSPIQVTVENTDPCNTDQTPPSTTITVPQDGADVEPGLIDITVSADDNVGGSGMDRVEFYVNGTLRSTDTGPPWTHGHWFTTEGPQTVQVTAYDQCGNSSSDTVNFSVTENGTPCDGDVTPPTGAVTFPTPGSVISLGDVTITGTASDNVNVFAVVFEIDGEVPAGATDLAPPYQYTWSPDPGVHQIRMRILDVCDNIGYSPTITVTVDGSVPSTVPNFQGRIDGTDIDGLTIYHTDPALSFTWSHASDPAGIDRYQIVVQLTGGGGWLYSPSIPYPATSHTIQTQNLAFGRSYSIHIRARNNLGLWGPFIDGGIFSVVEPIPTQVPGFYGEIGGVNLDGLTINTTNPLVTLHWNHATDPTGIERYQVVLQAVGGGWLYSPHVLYPNTDYNLQTGNLIPGESYSIHIRAKNNAGIWGPFIDGGTFTVQ